MKCIICKEAETRPGLTDVTLERDGFRLVIKNTPAQVCPNCGEAYAEEEVAMRLLVAAENLTDSGMLTDMQEYDRIVVKSE
jgi:YgiT-type zinc finger domain-containing protein